MLINNHHIYLLKPDQQAALRTMVLVAGVDANNGLPLLRFEVSTKTLYTAAVALCDYQGDMEYFQGGVVMRGKRFDRLRTIFLSRDIGDDALAATLKENKGYKLTYYSGDAIKLVMEGKPSCIL